ncbi:YcgL domain-containing protein [Granulosicoccus antarcticus]|uniref:YcgL domain-containing protein IMCC3135_29700 n=1 Tax=Granulosicoccus antarcticus IMCC3135 TaxID=1192854 RepID=A0A2Z2NXB3_9GAMM|nr:YcgL domain-containing protein [Granulosicoccus antarcticus]ASJ75989.1 Protein YcgL [Granulosicoccus antarcticus IMCC3135]
MQCYIYRSSIKDGLYVYLADEDGLERLPEPLRKQLGIPELSMTLDLQPDRKLGQENTQLVLENLESQGFHVQMPRDVEQLLEQIARNAQNKHQGNTGKD